MLEQGSPTHQRKGCRAVHAWPCQRSPVSADINHIGISKHISTKHKTACRHLHGQQRRVQGWARQDAVADCLLTASQAYLCWEQALPTDLLSKPYGHDERLVACCFLTWRSDSPMYMLINSGPFTDRKLIAHSVATAFATRVLPVPVPCHKSGDYMAHTDGICFPSQLLWLLSSIRNTADASHLTLRIVHGPGYLGKTD